MDLISDNGSNFINGLEPSFDPRTQSEGRVSTKAALAIRIALDILTL